MTPKSRSLPTFLQEFLSHPWEAVLATQGVDGHPQQTVMWYSLEGDEIIMTCLASRIKVRNIKRDPKATLTVVGEACYATLVGEVSIEHGADLAQEKLIALIERYCPERKDIMIRKLTDQSRVVLRFKKDRHYTHRVKNWLKQSSKN